MYGICGIAFLFYITKLPERILPGCLDIIGHSHQVSIGILRDNIPQL